MNKCPGCGSTLNNNQIICNRCFNIKNYNKIEDDKKYSNDEIINKINERCIYTFFLCDIFNLNNEVISLYQKINNDKVFVLTKEDLIPKNINRDKLLNRIKKVYNIKNIICISIKNGNGLKNFNNLLKNENLITGPTSGGKSSLINYISKSDITVSNHKNVTQDIIKIDYEGKSIYDFPGFDLFENNNIKQAGFIKPVILKLKKDYELNINDYHFSFDKDVNLTLYLSKGIVFSTNKIKDIYKNKYSVLRNDILLDNFGFIYVSDNALVLSNKKLEIRESLVGKHE